MDTENPYYARYDARYRKVRELGLPAFKGQDFARIDISLLDAFLSWRDDIRSARNVMEFGCGDGYLAVHLAEAGYSVVAFDYSEAAIRGCRRLARDAGVEVGFRTGDALDIDWAGDESFDLGVCNNVLQMFGTNRDRDRFVSEVRRVLKPKAMLFLNVPSGTDVPEQIESLDDHRKHREFLCEIEGTVEVDGVERKVRWPQVASWGPNVYSAAAYFEGKGFDLRYIHWEHDRGYGHGLTMYLERR